MRLDAFQADVRRQEQQAAVRRWRSAGVSEVAVDVHIASAKKCCFSAFGIFTAR
jgi:hypothetical protein